MRALVISDLHFGAWTRDPVLARPFALERLAPHLDDVDELILLGDVFDFMFSTMENAFAQADPFFELVRERMQGRRVVFLAGNHDHHIVVRDVRSRVELKIATGADGPDLERVVEAEHSNFFKRFLDRRLEGVQAEMAYPTYKFGHAHLCHGHYLDVHVEGSLANRLLTKAVWTVAGGRPMEELTVEDYEAVIVPMTELFFTVAQLPRGTAAQQGFYNQFESLSRYLRIVGMAHQGYVRAREALAQAVRRIRGRGVEPEPSAGPDLFDLGAGAARGRSLSVALQQAGARIQESVVLDRESAVQQLASSPPSSSPVSLALGAYGEVTRNLGWSRRNATLVFAHTHQPLDGVFDPATGPVRFWNTGSWVYEPPLANRDSYLRYLRTAWPGTAVLIDTARAEPRVVEMLADLNPLSGPGADPAPMLAGESLELARRAARYDAELRAEGVGLVDPELPAVN